MSDILSNNTLYYDATCALCSRVAHIFATLFPIAIQDANQNKRAASLMKKEYTWVYCDRSGVEHYRFDVIRKILSLRILTSLLSHLITLPVFRSFFDRWYIVIARCRYGTCNHHPHTKKRRLLKFVILLGTAVTVIFIFQKRFSIYESLGHTFFATPVIGNVSLYNIPLAENFFTKANRKEQPTEWVNYQLSRINFIKGDYQRALFFADKELELYPENCRTHYIRGLTYGYIEHIDEAIDDFIIFNKCFPDTWAGVNDLSWFYFRKGDIDSAIKIIEASLLKDNNTLSPWLQNTYGVVLMNKKRYLESENALRIALYLANNMTEEKWGEAYPGNNPLIYGEGLTSMRKTIQNNLTTLLAKNNGQSFLMKRAP